LKIAYSDDQNVKLSYNSVFESLSCDLKIVALLLNYLIKSNGFGLEIRDFEDNVLDQCKWTTDLLNMAIAHIGSPKEEKKTNKTTNKNRR